LPMTDPAWEAFEDFRMALWTLGPDCPHQMGYRWMWAIVKEGMS